MSTSRKISVLKENEAFRKFFDNHPEFSDPNYPKEKIPHVVVEHHLCVGYTEKNDFPELEAIIRWAANRNFDYRVFLHANPKNDHALADWDKEFANYKKECPFSVLAEVPTEKLVNADEYKNSERYKAAEHKFNTLKSQVGRESIMLKKAKSDATPFLNAKKTNEPEAIDHVFSDTLFFVAAMQELQVMQNKAPDIVIFLHHHEFYGLMSYAEQCAQTMKLNDKSVFHREIHSKLFKAATITEEQEKQERAAREAMQQAITHGESNAIANTTETLAAADNVNEEQLSFPIAIADQFRQEQVQTNFNFANDDEVWRENNMTQGTISNDLRQIEKEQIIHIFNRLNEEDIDEVHERLNQEVRREVKVAGKEQNLEEVEALAVYSFFIGLTAQKYRKQLRSESPPHEHKRKNELTHKDVLTQLSSSPPACNVPKKLSQNTSQNEAINSIEKRAYSLPSLSQGSTFFADRKSTSAPPSPKEPLQPANTVVEVNAGAGPR